MASTTTTCALTSPCALVDGRALSSRQQPAPPPHCVSLPLLPPLPHAAARQSRAQKTGAYCHRIARNVAAMATGESLATKESPPEVTTRESLPEVPTRESPPEVETELPEIVKSIKEAWDKVEDKYAVTSLAVAGAVALWGTTGVVSAIDRLPLVPGVLELVGIGYSGWFAYKNLIFKPEREALLAKIKSTYNDIIGSS